MSNWQEFSAKTVDEALTEALIKLETTSDQIEYEVIEKGSTGFLGIARKDAVIKVRKKYSVEGDITEFLQKIFAAMDLKVEIIIEKAEDEYYVRVQHEMTKTHYISFIAAVSSERIQLVKRYPEEEAEARFKMQGVQKIFFFCNKDGLFSLNVKKGIDDKEAAYSDYEIRRKQEKIMDIFYEFGELMNLDPCDEKVQKAAEELHEITGGQKQVVIEMLNNKYWKKAIRVAGGNGSLEFARKVMQEFYQTR